MSGVGGRGLRVRGTRDEGPASLALQGSQVDGGAGATPAAAATEGRSYEQDRIVRMHFPSPNRSLARHGEVDVHVHGHVLSHKRQFHPSK